MTGEQNAAVEALRAFLKDISIDPSDPHHQSMPSDTVDALAPFFEAIAMAVDGSSQSDIQTAFHDHYSEGGA